MRTPVFWRWMAALYIVADWIPAIGAWLALDPPVLNVIVTAGLGVIIFVLWLDALHPTMPEEDA